MMIVNVQFQAGTFENLRKTPDTGSLLAIDDNQAGDGVEINILGAGNGRKSGCRAIKPRTTFSWEPEKEISAAG